MRGKRGRARSVYGELCVATAFPLPDLQFPYVVLILAIDLFISQLLPCVGFWTFDTSSLGDSIWTFGQSSTTAKSMHTTSFTNLSF